MALTMNKRIFYYPVCHVFLFQLDDDRASTCSELSSGRNSHTSDKLDSMATEVTKSRPDCIEQYKIIMF